MSYSSRTLEHEAAVAAPRIFKAAVLEWHILVPKLAPEVYVSGAFVEGDGVVGSVRHVNFTSILPFSYVKQRIDFVDNDNYELKQTMIEGGGVRTGLETLSMHIKVESKGNNASVVKVVSEYKLLPGVANEMVEKLKELVEHVINMVEGYLLANPDAYV